MKTPKRNIKFLRKAEVRRIIEACPNDSRGRRDRAIMSTLFSTVLRISELLALEKKTFTNLFTETKISKKGEMITEFKTKELAIIGKGQVQRTVYVSSEALRDIFNYIIKGKAGEDLRLFPITARQCQRMVKARAKN